MSWRYFGLACALVLSLVPVESLAGGAKTVWVNSYTKSDGTYVSGHWRSPPDGTGAGYPAIAGGIPVESYPGQKIKEFHYYKISVYENGELIASSGSGLSAHSFNTQQEAAEYAVWEVQEKLRSLLYSKGLGHNEVRNKIEMILSQDACEVEVKPVETTPEERYSHNQGIMYYATATFTLHETCIVPSTAVK